MEKVDQEVAYEGDCVCQDCPNCRQRAFENAEALADMKRDREAVRNA